MGFRGLPQARTAAEKELFGQGEAATRSADEQ